MLRGLTTFNHVADDLDAASRWNAELGPGFVTASVVDPFGNVLGVMFNQHYLDVLATQAAV